MQSPRFRSSDDCEFWLQAAIARSSSIRRVAALHFLHRYGPVLSSNLRLRVLECLLSTELLVCASRDALATFRVGDQALTDVEFAVEAPGEYCAVDSGNNVVAVARGLGAAVVEMPLLNPGQNLDGFHANTVVSVAVSRWLDLIATGGSDATVVVWSALHSPSTGEFGGRVLHGHTDWVTVLRFCRDASGRVLLLSGGDDGQLFLWDALTGEVLKQSSRLAPCIRTAACTPVTTGEGAAFGGDDPSIQLLDLSSSCSSISVVGSLRGPRGAPASMDFSRDGRFLVCVGEDGEALFLFDVARRHVLATCEVHTGRRMCMPFMDTISSVTFLDAPPTSSVFIIACASSDGHVITWVRKTADSVVKRDVLYRVNLEIGRLVGMARSELALQ